MVKIAEKYPQWSVMLVEASGVTAHENYCAESLEVCLGHVLAMMTRRKQSGWAVGRSGWTLVNKDAVWVVLPEDFDPDAKLGIATLIAAGERALYPQRPMVAKPRRTSREVLKSMGATEADLADILVPPPPKKTPAKKKAAAKKRTVKS